jgi:Fic family protein
MAGFIRKKNIKGKEYFYYVYQYRIKDKTKQKVLKYLGSVMPNKQELKNLEKEFKERKIQKILRSNLKFKPKYVLKEDIEKFEKLKSDFFGNLKNLTLKSRRELENKFKTGFTYHSCAIEGNTLSRQQVDLYLNKKLSVTGKHRFELLEIENHDVAIEYMATYEKDICEKFIKELHQTLTNGEEYFRHDESFYDYDPDFISGEYRQDMRFISGSNKKLSSPNNILKDMRELIKWYNQNKYVVYPLELAGVFHMKFVKIHPFSDGNGRCARLLTNFILQRSNFPMVDISNKNREEYISILEEENEKDFILFLYNELKSYKKQLFDIEEEF